MNYYDEALQIADALAAEGLITESLVLRDAVESSSTATEMLMRLRWQIQQTEAAKKTGLLQTRGRIELLSAAIDRELSS